MKGRVKWWSKEKSCGFIEYNTHESIFAHLDETTKPNKSLCENQEIEFLLEKKDSSLYIKLIPQKPQDF